MATTWDSTRSMTTGVAIARWTCRIMGTIFLLIALMGFISADHYVLGVFMVNGVHNVVHLLSGAVLLAMGFATEKAAAATLWVFFAVYGLVTVLGFLRVDFIVDLLHLNQADNWLHVAITALTGGAAAASEAQRRSAVTTHERTVTTTTPTNPPPM